MYGWGGERDVGSVRDWGRSRGRVREGFVKVYAWRLE